MGGKGCSTATFGLPSFIDTPKPLSLFPLSLRAFARRILPLLLLLPTACQKPQTVPPADELARQDSLALSVGILPVMECLPLYYAQQMGMLDSLPAGIRLQTFLSQMDCDTAVLRRHIAVAYGDIARALLMPADMRLLTSVDGRLSLVTARTKRIRQLRHLNERMIALDRLSQSDYWSDELMKQADMDLSAVYRPQINDIQLRTSMLTEQLIDAALLPEPYATQAVRQGNRRLFTANDSTLSFACFVASDSTLADTLRVQQIRLLFDTYNKAAALLNSDRRNDDSVRVLLCRHYNLPPEVADSIKIPTFHPVHAPRPEGIGKVAEWLRSRECPVSAQRCESLLSPLLHHEEKTESRH